MKAALGRAEGSAVAEGTEAPGRKRKWRCPQAPPRGSGNGRRDMTGFGSWD
jgi:hypothetical protein